MVGNYFPVLLVIVPALLVWAFLSGKDLPLISTERGAFIGLAIVGFVMCSLALSTRSPQAEFSWLNPFILLAAILGTAALLLVVSVLIGKTLTVFTDTRTAFIALAAIIFAKWVITSLHIIVGNF
jgi:hypothetical protein